ncbi:protein kinase domain-containing protein [Streptomyces sp. NPDC002851]
MSGRLVSGRYELASLIGQGGMGQVWTAYDQRLDRRVAVKLLRPDRVAGAESEELRRRFVRECRVTAQVDHPGLVTVHDAGSDDDDLFLVMQHVGGIDLAAHIEQHAPYPLAWAVSVAAQLCAVLSAVHAVPIVHRDLKPRNVMVRPDGTLTVLDLGVASVMDTDTTRLTHTGAPIGSPAYMAPEQATGGTVGPYTDLYALGVLLYELLGGTVPFDGATVLAVLHSHLYEQPAPVRGHRPEVPEGLDALVLRLLAKDPEHRPDSAQEVYEALLPYLPARGTPSGSPLDPTRPFLRPHAPWPDREPAPTATVAASPTAPVTPPATPPAASNSLGTPGTSGTPGTPGTPGTSGTSGIPAMPTTPPPGAPVSGVPGTPGVPGAGNAGSTADIAKAVDDVKRLLAEGRITQAVDVLGAILPTAEARHGARSTVVRSLRKQYAATLMDDGQYRRALPELRRLADEHGAEAGQADPVSLQFRYEVAQCLEQLGEPAAALAEYRALLPYYENRYVGGDPATALELRRRIGQLLLSLGDRAAAHDTLARLLYDAERLHGPHHPLPGEVRRTLQWLGRVRG